MLYQNSDHSLTFFPSRCFWGFILLKKFQSFCSWFGRGMGIVLTDSFLSDDKSFHPALQKIFRQQSPQIPDKLQTQELEDINVSCSASLKKKVFPKGWINKLSLLMECSLVNRHDGKIECALTGIEYHQKIENPTLFSVLTVKANIRWKNSWNMQGFLCVAKAGR